MPDPSYLDTFVSRCLDDNLDCSGIVSVVKQAIAKEAIRRSFGNKCAAARMLRIHRNNVTRWISLYRVNP